MPNESNNKRIAKNTLLLYIRMAIALVVSLYTSRIVLNALGVEDYGIYGIAGGFIYSFGFLNSSLSASTSRFITYEMGKKEEKQLNKIFNSAFIIHLTISFIIIVLAETLGLWILINKLDIPETRMNAAHWVYQLSVASMVVGITQVPYNATIIAHERINIYAYVEMLNIVFKLILVYLLLICDTDRLILYAVFNAIISIGVIFFYRLYCHRNFAECSLNFNTDKSILRKMLVFSGWDFVGNMGVSVREQGIGILINMFFGVIANAASSIVSQITTMVMAFASNIMMAVKPQIIKSYAGQDYARTNDLIHFSSIGILYLLMILILPISFELEYILNIWLGQVPQYCIGLTRLTLIFNFFSTFAIILLTIPHAAGKNKYPSLFNGLIYLCAFPISYIILQLYPIIWIPYIYNIISMIAGMTIIGWLASKYLPGFSFTTYLFGFLTKNILVVSGIGIIIIVFHSHWQEPSFLRLCITSIITTFLLLISCLYVGFNKQERCIIFYKIKCFIRTIDNK